MTTHEHLKRLLLPNVLVVLLWGPAMAHGQNIDPDTEPIPCEAAASRSNAIGVWVIPESERIIDLPDGSILGPGHSYFRFDGVSVTVVLMAERELMWRTRDDHFRVSCRWVGDELQYRPPFGDFTPLAWFSAEAGFSLEAEQHTYRYVRVDSFEPLAESLRPLTVAREIHDYTVQAMDVPEWLGTDPAPPLTYRAVSGLFIREGDSILDAPADDVAVAEGYAEWWDKGPTTNGTRLTIIAAQRDYRVGERLRVIHVLEMVEATDQWLHIMGPKPVYGETFDGQLNGGPPPVPDYPWMNVYDGAVLPSPDVDYNFEITEFLLDEPGVHEILWQIGALRSNVLRIRVTGE